MSKRKQNTKASDGSFPGDCEQRNNNNGLYVPGSVPKAKPSDESHTKSMGKRKFEEEHKIDSIKMKNTSGLITVNALILPVKIFFWLMILFFTGLKQTAP